MAVQVSANSREDKVELWSQRLAEVFLDSTARKPVMIIGFRKQDKEAIGKAAGKRFNQLRFEDADKLKASSDAHLPDVRLVIMGDQLNHGTYNQMKRKYGGNSVLPCLKDYALAKEVMVAAVRIAANPTKLAEDAREKELKPMPPSQGKEPISPTEKREPVPAKRFKAGELKAFVIENAGPVLVTTGKISQVAKDLHTLAEGLGYQTTVGSVEQTVRNYRNSLQNPRPSVLGQAGSSSFEEKENEVPTPKEQPDDVARILEALEVLGVNPALVEKLRSLTSALREIEGLRVERDRSAETNAELAATNADLARRVQELETRLNDIHERSSPH